MFTSTSSSAAASCGSSVPGGGGGTSSELEGKGGRGYNIIYELLSIKKKVKEKNNAPHEVQLHVGSMASLLMFPG